MKTTFTVEVYKKDARTKSGERMVLKKDYDSSERSILEHTYKNTYRAAQGYRYEIHDTYVTRTNIISNNEFQERYDTPIYCSPASESYWSM
jgi:hypothetical protein|tara:strand:+ start:7664 stop:7936 length:273 start_codon:yes stop_codon:yes gene_type:complete